MLDPKNSINITGGVTRDPESPSDNLVKFSIAVDYAGSEKGGSSTGYFDVVYWTNNDDNKRNADFVKNQVKEGKLKKGSQVQILGRLTQERWSTEGDSSKKSRVVIVAESLTYSGSSRPADSASSSSNASIEVPSEF